MTNPTDNWQPGDLALCVRGGPYLGSSMDREYPQSGQVFTVLGCVESTTRQDPSTSIPFLVLKDAPFNSFRVGCAWATFRFRKIHPLTDEEIEEDRRERLVDRANNPQRV